jgi:hypothetical protein
LGVGHALPDHLRNGIQEFVEQCETAAEALERVRALVKAGLPNVRIFDDDGKAAQPG